jgi:prophage endopeptidase
MNALLIKAVAALGIALVLGGAAYSKGRAAAAQNFNLQLSAISREHAKQLAAMEAVARSTERAAVVQIAAIDVRHQEQLNNEKDKLDAAIAGLRAGTVQLRKRFACDASASGVVPSVATSTSNGDAAAGRGLQGADAELLIREAATADEIVLQLQACQAVVAADRAGP